MALGKQQFLSLEGGSGVDGLVTSARWKEFKQMMAWACGVFMDAGGFSGAA